MLSDGLSLFTHGGTTVLEDIFDHESKIKLNLLFEKAQVNKSALNWELTTTPQEPVVAVYCSIISWLENVIIRFSNLPIPSFFFDLTIDNEKPAALFFPFQSNSENEEKTTGYTYLTTELTYIQKELQRKNIQIEELKERLEILANIDPLTGLYNRHAIVNRLKMELVRAMREKKLLGLAVVDIDHLQEINDTFGHPIGDECLKTTANMTPSEGLAQTNSSSFFQPIQSPNLIPFLSVCTTTFLQVKFRWRKTMFTISGLPSEVFG